MKKIQRLYVSKTNKKTISVVKSKIKKWQIQI